MKTLALTLTVVLALIAAPLAIAEQSEVIVQEAAISAPAADAVVDAPGFPPDDFKVLLGLKPGPINSCNFVGPCDQFDSPDCDYHCGGDECCTAVTLNPFCYCGPICA